MAKQRPPKESQGNSEPIWRGDNSKNFDHVLCIRPLRKFEFFPTVTFVGVSGVSGWASAFEGALCVYASILAIRTCFALVDIWIHYYFYICNTIVNYLRILRQFLKIWLFNNFAYFDCFIISKKRDIFGRKSASSDRLDID